MRDRATLKSLASVAFLGFASEILSSAQDFKTQEARLLARPGPAPAARTLAPAEEITTEKQLDVSFRHSLNRICT